MKGIALPIEVIVIVVIAVIILLALIALFFPAYSPFSTAVGLESVKSEACRQYVQQTQCRGDVKYRAIYNYDANYDGKLEGTAVWEWGKGWDDVCGKNLLGTGDNLASLCYCQLSRWSEADCRKLCGCP